MKQLRQEAQSSESRSNNICKETRWDRIRKRCTAGSLNGGAYSLRTETVRKFIEKDYIGKHKTSFLQGENNVASLLNPALVMDMRHEMFRKIPRKLPLATVESLRSQKGLKSCLNHNIAVEERYIDNELRRFRQQLENNRNRNKVKLEKNYQQRQKDLLFVDNKILMDSLEASSKHINDFYTTSLNAFNEVEHLIGYVGLRNEDENEDENHLNIVEDIGKIIDDALNKGLGDFIETEMEVGEDEILAETIDFHVEYRFRNAKATLPHPSAQSDFLRRTPSPLTPTDEFMRPMREAAARHQTEMRRVHFEDEIALHKLHKRENSTCSNTSDGLDSIISDLAEEALCELQMEEQVTSDNRQQQQQYVESEQNGEPLKVDIPDQATVQPLAIVGATVQSQQNEGNLLRITQLNVPSKKLDKNPNKRNPTSSSEDDNETTSSSTSVHEKNLIVEELFRSRAETNAATMRKYFLKWIHYTTISKIEREDLSKKTDRIHQINTFLDKLRKEKVRMKNNPKTSTETAQQVAAPKENAQITKKYHNKIKMQQDIIDLQRLKLERQERLIMELKLKKLSDEAKDARQEIKNELKAVMRSGDEKSKAKAKCLQLIGNLRDAEDEDEFKRLQGKSLLVPKFLQKMQERAIERSVRHEQARQRRLQLEAEREAQKIATEEAKRLEDEEAKRMRIEALKEKRRQEKMAKILKEREHQRMLENRRKAEEFCRHRLLRRVGMEGFKRLLERKRDYTRKSEALRQKVTKRIVFVAWRDYFLCENARRIQKANNFNDLLVKRNAIRIWSAYAAAERSKFYVAMDWYDMKLSTFMFKEWASYTKRMKLIEKSKMRKAIAHFEWNLKFKVLDCWQRLPQVLRLEKETEERRQRWRMKIWELLPDYTPRLDSFV